MNIDKKNNYYLQELTAFLHLKPQQWTEIINYKEKLLLSNEKPIESPLIRKEIAESWIRSQKKGVLPDISLLDNILKPSEFSKIQRDNKLLLQTTEPIFNEALAFLNSKLRFSVGLIDKNGILLSNYNAQIEQLTYPGVNMSEELVGTAAHSLCAKLGKPICTIGPETYNKILQQGKVVISLPIFDTNGNITAVIALAYYRDFKQTIEEEELFTWLIAWQFSIAKKIEDALTLAQHKFRINIDNSILHTTFAMIDESVIFLDYNGQINHISHGGEQFLGMTSAKAKGKYYSDLFGELPQISGILQGKSPIPDIAATVSNLHGNKACKLKVNPLKINNKDIVGAIIRITELNKTTIENDKSKFPAKFTFDDIRGNSPELLRAKQLAKKVAIRDVGVLLIGETGSGKELFAQAIHNESHPHKPFVAINCAAIPKSLIESELLGYDGGSFTGAERKGRTGKIEMSNGGTLFLDEIGDMPLESQPTLLRVLEDKQVMRVGGNKYIPVDFRLIAATNKNLYEMVLKKEFREDLYFRLATFKILLPPLQGRDSDIIALTQFFIEQECRKLNVPKLHLEAAALRILVHYQWPGNIRQLKNVITHAVNMSENEMIQICDLPNELIDKPSSFGPSEVIKPIRELEKQSILDAMILTNNDLYQAAAMLGMSKSTLYRRLKEYQFPFKDTI